MRIYALLSKVKEYYMSEVKKRNNLYHISVKGAPADSGELQRENAAEPYYFTDVSYW